MVKLKFYDCKTAPSPRLVRIFLAEKQLHVPTIEVDLRNGEHLTSDFKKLNPHCTVPVLEMENGTKITSTQGCWRYLEEVVPAPPLLGRDPEEKAKVSDLIWHVEMDGLQAVAEGLRNTAKRLKNRAVTGPENIAQIPKLGDRGKLRAKSFLARLDEMLEDQEYMAGDHFSAVDIMTLVVIDFAGWLKIELPDSSLKAKNWYERVSARPSAKL